MSRTRKALLTAWFSYSQMIVAMVAGLFLIRYTLGTIGDRPYGLWLAVTEMVGYIALADLGIFVVFPWLIAAADGAGASVRVRSLVASGLALGVVVGLGFVGLSLIGWGSASRAFRDPADREAFAGPYFAFVVACGLGIPTRVFTAVLAGKQDVVCSGLLALGQVVGGFGLTFSLLARGYGLYALALGTSIPPLVVGLIAGIRVAVRFPELLRPMAVPTFEGGRELIAEGFGAWVGVVGVRLLMASYALLLTAFGGGDMVVRYTCIAKLSGVLTNLMWVAPDACLVGLAQLHAEGRRDRARQVAAQIVRMNSLLGVFLAILILALNPAFVTIWVGQRRYGGDLLNGLVALAALVSCVAHGTITPVGAIGSRAAVGFTSLANGIGFLLLSAAGWAALGVHALPVAYIVSTAGSQVFIGLRLCHSVFGFGLSDLAPSRPIRQACRVALALGMATAAGSAASHLPPYLAAGVGAGAVLLAGWLLRPLLAELEWPPRAAQMLRTVYLLPAAELLSPRRNLTDLITR